MALTAKELAARILEIYEPDEEVIWQTFSRKQIDANYFVNMTDDQWTEFLDNYGDHEVTVDDFGIGDYLPDEVE